MTEFVGVCFDTLRRASVALPDLVRSKVESLLLAVPVEMPAALH